MLVEPEGLLKAAQTLKVLGGRYKVGPSTEGSMERLDWKIAALAVALMMPASLASAQWDASTAEGTSTGATAASAAQIGLAARPRARRVVVAEAWAP